jgi:POT family proton-dependent oligopeptide transporter
MGINLGAAMSGLLCGYIGETFGWHYGFGLATIGMLAGLTVFVAPTRVTQILIMAASAAYAAGLLFFRPDNLFSIGVNVFTALSLLAAAVIAWIALGRGGLPASAGQAPDRELLHKPVFGPVSRLWTVYIGTVAAIVIAMFLVSGFSFFSSDGNAVSLTPQAWLDTFQSSDNPYLKMLGTVFLELGRPAGLVLFLSALGAFAYLGIETYRMETIARHRMYVVMILTFFSMLFWWFFEQAGSSVNNFTDRNVDRVLAQRIVTADMVGTTLRIQPTQAQLGYRNGGQLFTIDMLDSLRKEHKNDEKPDPYFKIDWVVTQDDVGMELADRVQEIPGSTFQSVNPVCILIFGLGFTALWSFLANRRLEPSTTAKFALGHLQLGLGFLAFWYGAQTSDSRGMVAAGWLVLGYMLHTSGELCISPVGLAMVVKLAPVRLISTVMGMWFLATAFSEYFAGIIAQFTGVTKGGGSSIPLPIETVHVYGNVFGSIAVIAIGVSVVCFALSPLLTHWMHEEDESQGPATAAGH